MKSAKEMVDYIADYLQSLRKKRVFPDVQPGYMQNLLPDHAPTYPDKYDDIIADVERVIMPGITHWQSPYMHAYFPALNSYPSLLGDMLADAISCVGFTWASSPACTELETIVMDWLGKMLGMPTCFLHGDKNSKNMGGGCIQVRKVPTSWAYWMHMAYIKRNLHSTGEHPAECQESCPPGSVYCCWKLCLPRGLSPPPMVNVEREFYNQAVSESKDTVAAHRIQALGPNAATSRQMALGYYTYFDFAQQVHLPSSPMQPGPLYLFILRFCLESAFRNPAASQLYC